MSIALISLIVMLAIAIIVRAAYIVRFNSLLDEAQRYMRKGADKLEDGEWSAFAGDFEAANRNYRRAARRFARIGDRTMARHCVKMAQEADKGLNNAWY